MSDTNASPTLDDYRELLSVMSIVELVVALNREVGNPGWVSSRGRYLVALNEVLHSRGLDLSAVGGLRAIPGLRKFRLEDNHLLYVDRPDDK